MGVLYHCNDRTSCWSGLLLLDVCSLLTAYLLRMPEFYDQGSCRYQMVAQPYLAAIARGIRDRATSRAFLLEGTAYEQSFAGAEPLWREQWNKRDPADTMKCPF